MEKQAWRGATGQRHPLPVRRSEEKGLWTDRRGQAAELRGCGADQAGIAAASSRSAGEAPARARHVGCWAPGDWLTHEGPSAPRSISGHRGLPGDRTLRPINVHLFHMPYIGGLYFRLTYNLGLGLTETVSLQPSPFQEEIY